jgi:hypothetical protein
VQVPLSSQTAARDSALASGESSSGVNLRDAFFGGRTNCAKKYWKSDGVEKDFYNDVTYLYPHVNKNGRYVVGAPEIRRRSDCQPITDDFEGFVSCRVLSPTDLYHPVLPARYLRDTDVCSLSSLCRGEKSPEYLRP